jgi:hypothetical protein
MLGIKVGTEYLDLLPGTQLDLEQNNPYLQFNDEIAGEYSMPVQLPATPKNIRLTQYASLLQTRADRISIDCAVYQSGLQYGVGKLRIEKPNIHLNKSSRSSISCYILFGISSFYKDIQNVDLRSVNFGGTRSFTDDSFNPAGAGFWGHVNSVINASPGYGTSGYDYALFPCINKDYDVNSASDIVNNVMLDTGACYFSRSVQRSGQPPLINPIIPFPYLKYVLTKAVEHVGWRIVGDILYDADFKKIVLWNVRSINWGWRARHSGVYIFHISPTVTFDLQNHVPNVTIAKFLMAIKNRLGLWYDFDRVNKVIYVKKIDDALTANQKNFTQYANPLVQKTVFTKKQSYSVRTRENIKAFDTSLSYYLGKVNTKTGLPTPDESLVDRVALVVNENNFYICQQNTTTEAWEWAMMMGGIGGVIPEDPAAEIVTDALTAPSEYFDGYLDMLPHFDETGIRTGVFGEDYDFQTILLLFNHGMQLNASGDPYPLGGHHIYTSAGVQVGNWSLAYKAKKQDGTEVGLYDRNFKRFIDTITSGEEFEVVLNLPLVEYMLLRWSETLNINNVKMYVKIIKATLPYKGSVTVECLRV